MPVNHEISELYNTFKEVKPKLMNIDENEYTINLLNFYTEMLYTAVLYERGEDFVKYLQERIEILTPLVDEGETYIFKHKTDEKGDKHYKMSLYLYLAYKQTELKATTVGYPHIHIGLWTKSTFEPEKLKRKKYKIVKEYSDLNDIDVAPSKKKGLPTKVLEYVCKNHSSKVVYESLKRAKVDTTIVTAIITSMKHYRKLAEIITHIANTKGENKLTSNKKSKYNKSIAMMIMVSMEVYKKYLDDTPAPKSPPKVPIKKIRVIDAEKNISSAYIHYIQNYMINNNYVVCDGLIYKKVEGSKSSYTRKYSIEDFINRMERRERFYNVAPKLRSRLIRDMNGMEDDKDDKDEENTIDFPKIKMNYRMIEFKDFYYCLVTRAIYKEQYNYHTYLYCPEVSLANLSESISNLIEHSVWIKQLRASQVYNVQDIALLFSIVHNRKNKKDASLLIAGDSNTGKSTMHRPFRELFPPEKVGYLKTITEHHIYDQVYKKEVVIVDEANSMLRMGSTTAGRADSLLLMGAEMAIANKKLGEIRAIDTSKCSLTLTVNMEPDDEKCMKMSH
jgi:hypothetical protein